MVENNVSFDKPDLATQTWKEVFKVYDNNFSKLKGLLMTVGGSYKIERFDEFTGDTLILENPYEVGRNQIFVYKNDTILWKDYGYEETGENSIKLKEAPTDGDVVYVVNICFATLLKDLQYLYETQKWLEGKYELVDSIINATVQADWEAEEGPSMILNKPSYFPRAMIKGIENVENTLDKDKPASNPQKELFISKADCQKMIEEKIEQAIAKLPKLTYGAESAAFPSGAKDGDVHVKY